MAKKLVKLSFLDIVLQADAETIREALEARTQIDGLLVEREEAYKKIDALERQIEGIVGEEGVFVYPEAPVPVAGLSKQVPASRIKPKPPAPKPDKDQPEVKAEKATEEIPEEKTSEPDKKAEKSAAPKDDTKANHKEK